MPEYGVLMIIKYHGVVQRDQTSPSRPPVNLTRILSFTYFERSRIASRRGLSPPGGGGPPPRPRRGLVFCRVVVCGSTSLQFSVHRQSSEQTSEAKVKPTKHWNSDWRRRRRSGSKGRMEEEEGRKGNRRCQTAMRGEGMELQGRGSPRGEKGSNRSQREQQTYLGRPHQHLQHWETPSPSASKALSTPPPTSLQRPR